MTLLLLNLAEAPNRKPRHGRFSRLSSQYRCNHVCLLIVQHCQGGPRSQSYAEFLVYVKCCVQSCPTFRPLATSWTPVRWAPLSLGFSRQECWSGLPCPPPGDFPNPGIAPRSPALQADSLLSEPPVLYYICIILIFETSRTKYP